MRGSRKLLYFGSSAGIGLTYHLAIASKYFSKMKEIDFTLMSGNQEQFKGLFDMLEKNHVNFVRFNGIDEAINLLKKLIPFLKFIKKEKCDIIHVQTNVQLIYGVLAKFFCKNRLVYTIHAHRHGERFKSAFVSTILSLFLGLCADLVITLSTQEQEYFRKFMLNSTFVPLGYEDCHVHSSLHTDSMNLIYSAVFHRRKGHKWLVESVLPLMRQHSDIKMFLPGDGEMLRNCKRLVEDEEMAEKIIFPGWLNKVELNKYMSLANLVIVASKSETFGHCIVEPMFYSLPVISTPVGIAPDVIKDGYNGFIVNYGDKDTLREKILYFYNNRDKLIEFGKRSREIAQRELTWEVIARKYAKVLYEL